MCLIASACPHLKSFFVKIFGRTTLSLFAWVGVFCSRGGRGVWIGGRTWPPLRERRKISLLRATARCDCVFTSFRSLWICSWFSRLLYSWKCLLWIHTNRSPWGYTGNRRTNSNPHTRENISTVKMQQYEYWSESFRIRKQNVQFCRVAQTVTITIVLVYILTHASTNFLTWVLPETFRLYTSC